MDLFNIAAVLMVLVSFFGYINFRYFKLQNSIGIMIVAILFSLFIIFISNYYPEFIKFEKSIVSTIDFQKLLLNGMLSFMLFAGALHLDFNQLKAQKWNVLAFTTLGVLLSTAVIGLLLYYLLTWVGLLIPMVHCFLFGALISPTDPVAVMGILKKAGINKTVEINIVGESCVSCAVQGYNIRIRSLKMNSITVIEMREGLSTKMYRHISQTALWGLVFTTWS